MAKKNKFKRSYRYECTMTGESFTTNAEAKSPGDLLSIKAYYEMHPEEDDRPENIKVLVQHEEAEKAQLLELQKSLEQSTPNGK